MARQRGLWFSLECDWDESKWLAALPWATRAIWVLVVGRVKLHGRGGVCNAPDLVRFARTHDVPYDALVGLINAAVADNALRVTDETWTVTNWEFYQNTDPTNAERQRRFREKKQAEKGQFEPGAPDDGSLDNASNALRNGRNTTEQNNTEQNNTEQDTLSSENSQAAPVPVAKRKPKAKKAPKPDGSWLDSWIQDFKLAYPKRHSHNWVDATARFKRLFEGSSPPDPKQVLAAAAAYARTNPEPKYTATITTWIKEQRWCADYTQVAHTPTKPGDKFKTWTPEDLAEMGGENV